MPKDDSRRIEYRQIAGGTRGLLDCAYDRQKVVDAVRFRVCQRHGDVQIGSYTHEAILGRPEEDRILNRLDTAQSTPPCGSLRYSLRPKASNMAKTFSVGVLHWTLWIGLKT